MTHFLSWCNQANSPCNKGDFYPSLTQFLQIFQFWRPDIVFGEDGVIKASRIQLYTINNPSWVFRKDAMISLREDINHKDLCVFPVSFYFIYASHLVFIVRDTLQNVGICSGVILLITLPYVAHPLVSFFILINFVCFICELLAVMHFWALSLNSITMIVMIMAIGFSVDYSCHYVHAYLASGKETRKSRTVDAMSTIGSSVLKGGL